MEQHRVLRTISLDADAGQISAELARQGVPPTARVRVQAEILSDDGPPDGTLDACLAMALIGQAGGAFDWLADEPDLYSDADLKP